MLLDKVAYAGGEVEWGMGQVIHGVEVSIKQTDEKVMDHETWIMELKEIVVTLVEDVIT